MSIKNIKWLTGTLMAVAFATGTSSCSDDHFDISSAAAGKQTLWQNIQSQSQLSQFADLLQRVKYSQTEEKTTSETYAALLNGEQTFTVWAPVNGSFDYNYYSNLLKSGIRDSIYKVEQELIRNNMTRYSLVINSTDSVKINLFNSKSVWLNYDKKTIKGTAITQPNIGASNGILHITSTPMAYQPNLYEYMALRSDLDSICTFIKSFQKTEFNEDASTQGPTIDGKVTWVDSITYLSNDYTTRYMGAYLTQEDSNYVMILPTNDTWKEMIEKTKKYFHFKDSYVQDVNTQNEAGEDTLIKGAKTTFTQVELDSIVNMYTKNAICQDLVFNANWQYEQIPITSINDIRAADARQDSLLSTAGTKFKKTGTLNGTNTGYVVEVDDFATMFGNAAPAEVSNGYAYVVDNFAFPFKTYAPNINLSGSRAYESCDNMCEPLSNQEKIYIKPTWSIDGDTLKSDSTFKYEYFVIQNKNASSNPGAFFKVPNVLSCKYDIYVVIGYNTDYQLRNKFYAYISYDDADKRLANQQLKNPNEDAVDANGECLFESNHFVSQGRHLNSRGEFCYTDTVCIAKGFEFPVSYYGLSDAYPVIQIKSSLKSSERNLYCREIWVNAIILKSKEW